MISLQIESWDEFWGSGAQLTYNSYNETGEGLEFNPDTEAYSRLYDQGRLVILTVRDDGAMIGYLITVVIAHLHSRMIKSAFEEGLYLAPEYRKGTLGIRVIKFMEEVLKSLGVRRVYYTNRPQRDLSKLYARLGAKCVAEQWAKNLE